MDAIQKNLLKEVADLHEVPTGAYNIRANGKSAGRASSENIEIVPKAEADGIDVLIRSGTKNESVHMPVLLSESGITETVYNDFYIGELQPFFVQLSQALTNALFTRKQRGFGNEIVADAEFFGNVHEVCLGRGTSLQYRNIGDGVTKDTAVVGSLVAHIDKFSLGAVVEIIINEAIWIVGKQMPHSFLAGISFRNEYFANIRLDFFHRSA